MGKRRYTYLRHLRLVQCARTLLAEEPEAAVQLHVGESIIGVLRAVDGRLALEVQVTHRRGVLRDDWLFRVS